LVVTPTCRRRTMIRHTSIKTCSLALPSVARGDFLQLVVNKLSGYPPQLRGPGLVHRISADAQHEFLKGGLAAVGDQPKSSWPGRCARRRAEPASSEALIRAKSPNFGDGFIDYAPFCRVDRDSVHTRRGCYRPRVRSIALPLRHRRPWDLPRQ
jgi:hypothetical protein